MATLSKINPDVTSSEVEMKNVTKYTVLDYARTDISLKLSFSKWLMIALFFSTSVSFSQEDPDPEIKEYKDYKDKDQFEKFQKRRTIVGSWQINELKQGALVVRLKTNKNLIDALLAKGDEALAEEKAAEAFVINKNVMRAYAHHFNFCKVYFINSSSSDSLLKGARSGIFLDSNLQVNPSIVMKEKFYIIAERDYAYNSSIGFVPEDSARVVVEGGNPVREMGVVAKNKYGHQLKGPFPYYVKDKVFTNEEVPTASFSAEPRYIWTSVYDKNDPAIKPKFLTANSKRYNVGVKKQYTYEKQVIIVQQFNGSLHQFFSKSPRPMESDIPQDVRPFLY